MKYLVSLNVIDLLAFSKLQMNFNIFQTWQNEIKCLREREMTLQAELAAAAREVRRLRDQQATGTIIPNPSTHDSTA